MFKAFIHGRYFQIGRRKDLSKERKISVAIPASIVTDVPHLREKTSKIGLIGRAAAIFKVDRIIIYPDNPHVNQATDIDLIATLLSYMETPQYLRKKLFELRPELRYAGVLPPLRTPHHPLNRKMENLKIGEYREGVTVSKTKTGVLVDIGVEKPALISNKLLPMGRRVTVKIVKVNKRVSAELVSSNEIPQYWGYKVISERRSIGKILKNKTFDLKIATSKYGTSFKDVAVEIAEKWEKAKSILIAFGSPTKGLYEIVEREGLKLNEIVDFTVNTIPNQGTETVRTEEALIASLAVLNLHAAQGSGSQKALRSVKR
ncbi:RNA-binding protein [Candidatus Bathyarchaeota archaeon]|nr:MAG: RNA-binding protein [Candidatus Bathyarchaeota archaeon]